MIGRVYAPFGRRFCFCNTPPPTGIWGWGFKPHLPEGNPKQLLQLIFETLCRGWVEGVGSRRHISASADAGCFLYGFMNRYHPRRLRLLGHAERYNPSHPKHIDLQKCPVFVIFFQIWNVGGEIGYPNSPKIRLNSPEMKRSRQANNPRYPKFFSTPSERGDINI